MAIRYLRFLFLGKYYRNIRKQTKPTRKSSKSETNSTEHMPSRPKKRASSHRKIKAADVSVILLFLISCCLQTIVKWPIKLNFFTFHRNVCMKHNIFLFKMHIIRHIVE